MFGPYPPPQAAGPPAWAEPHDIEPELREYAGAGGARLPRPVAYTLGAQAARCFWIALIVGMAALLLTLARRDVRELAALRDGGEVVAGRVIDRFRRSGKSTSYHLKYDYVVNGQYHGGDFRVGRSRFEDAVVGEPVEVTYLPASPSAHRVGAVDDARVQGAYRRWVAGILAGIGLLAGIATLLELDRRKHLALLSEGFVAVGTVIDHREARTNGGRIYYLTYRFATPDGEGFTKKVQVPKAVYERYAFGNGRLTILYDSERPATNVPYAVLRHARLDSRA